jgi:hypothetical protein
MESSAWLGAGSRDWGYREREIESACIAVLYGGEQNRGRRCIVMWVFPQ